MDLVGSNSKPNNSPGAGPSQHPEHLYEFYMNSMKYGATSTLRSSYTALAVESAEDFETGMGHDFNDEYNFQSWAENKGIPTTYMDALDFGHEYRNVYENHTLKKGAPVEHDVKGEQTESKKRIKSDSVKDKETHPAYNDDNDKAQHKISGGKLNTQTADDLIVVAKDVAHVTAKKHPNISKQISQNTNGKDNNTRLKQRRAMPSEKKLTIFALLKAAKDIELAIALPIAKKDKLETSVVQFMQEKDAKDKVEQTAIDIQSSLGRSSQSIIVIDDNNDTTIPLNSKSSCIWTQDGSVRGISYHRRSHLLLRSKPSCAEFISVEDEDGFTADIESQKRLKYKNNISSYISNQLNVGNTGNVGSTIMAFMKAIKDIQISTALPFLKNEGPNPDEEGMPSGKINDTQTSALVPTRCTLSETVNAFLDFSRNLQDSLPPLPLSNLQLVRDLETPGTDLRRKRNIRKKKGKRSRCTYDFNGEERIIKMWSLDQASLPSRKYSIVVPELEVLCYARPPNNWKVPLEVKLLSKKSDQMLYNERREVNRATWYTAIRECRSNTRVQSDLDLSSAVQEMAILNICSSRENVQLSYEDLRENFQHCSEQRTKMSPKSKEICENTELKTKTSDHEETKLLSKDSEGTMYMSDESECSIPEKELLSQDYEEDVMVGYWSEVVGTAFYNSTENIVNRPIILRESILFKRATSSMSKQTIEINDQLTPPYLSSGTSSQGDEKMVNVWLKSPGESQSMCTYSATATGHVLSTELANKVEQPATSSKDTICMSDENEFSISEAELFSQDDKEDVIVGFWSESGSKLCNEFELEKRLPENDTGNAVILHESPLFEKTSSVISKETIDISDQTSPTYLGSEMSLQGDESLIDAWLNTVSERQITGKHSSASDNSTITALSTIRRSSVKIYGKVLSNSAEILLRESTEILSTASKDTICMSDESEFSIPEAELFSQEDQKDVIVGFWSESGSKLCDECEIETRFPENDASNIVILRESALIEEISSVISKETIDVSDQTSPTYLRSEISPQGEEEMVDAWLNMVPEHQITGKHSSTSNNSTITALSTTRRRSVKIYGDILSNSAEALLKESTGTLSTSSKDTICMSDENEFSVSEAELFSQDDKDDVIVGFWSESESKLCDEFELEKRFPENDTCNAVILRESALFEETSSVISKETIDVTDEATIKNLGSEISSQSNEKMVNFWLNMGPELLMTDKHYSGSNNSTITELSTTRQSSVEMYDEALANAAEKLLNESKETLSTFSKGTICMSDENECSIPESDLLSEEDQEDVIVGFWSESGSKLCDEFELETRFPDNDTRMAVVLHESVLFEETSSVISKETIDISDQTSPTYLGSELSSQSDERTVDAWLNTVPELQITGEHSFTSDISIKHVLSTTRQKGVEMYSDGLANTADKLLKKSTGTLSTSSKDTICMSDENEFSVSEAELFSQDDKGDVIVGFWSESGSKLCDEFELETRFPENDTSNAVILHESTRFEETSSVISKETIDISDEATTVNLGSELSSQSDEKMVDAWLNTVPEHQITGEHSFTSDNLTIPALSATRGSSVEMHDKALDAEKLPKESKETLSISSTGTICMCDENECSIPEGDLFSEGVQKDVIVGYWSVSGSKLCDEFELEKRFRGNDTSKAVILRDSALFEETPSVISKETIDICDQTTPKYLGSSISSQCDERMVDLWLKTDESQTSSSHDEALISVKRDHHHAGKDSMTSPMTETVAASEAACLDREKSIDIPSLKSYTSQRSAIWNVFEDTTDKSASIPSSLSSGVSSSSTYPDSFYHDKEKYKDSSSYSLEMEFDSWSDSTLAPSIPSVIDVTSRVKDPNTSSDDTKLEALTKSSSFPSSSLKESSEYADVSTFSSHTVTDRNFDVCENTGLSDEEFVLSSMNPEVCTNLWQSSTVYSPTYLSKKMSNWSKEGDLSLSSPNEVDRSLSSSISNDYSNSDRGGISSFSSDSNKLFNIHVYRPMSDDSSQSRSVEEEVCWGWLSAEIRPKKSIIKGNLQSISSFEKESTLPWRENNFHFTEFRKMELYNINSDFGVMFSYIGSNSNLKYSNQIFSRRKKTPRSLYSGQYDMYSICISTSWKLLHDSSQHLHPLSLSSLCQITTAVLYLLD